MPGGCLSPSTIEYMNCNAPSKGASALRVNLHTFFYFTKNTIFITDNGDEYDDYGPVPMPGVEGPVRPQPRRPMEGRRRSRRSYWMGGRGYSNYYDTSKAFRVSYPTAIMKLLNPKIIISKCIVYFLFILGYFYLFEELFKASRSISLVLCF